MKRILNFVIAIIICGNLFSQTAPTYSFRKPVSNGANSWKFVNVLSGVDAIVTITGSKNATLYRIDDSTVYKSAWQPFIKITNSTNSSSDSSYLEFKIVFQKTNGTPSSQNTLAMTVIDLDGSNSLREFIRTSNPATNLNIANSAITRWSDLKWLNAVSGTTNYSNIDTSNYAAMTQYNYSTVKTFTMRVGVVGSISGGTVRQHSFYFKPFTIMTVALPVTLTRFDAKLDNMGSELNWSTVTEDNLNRFEICRSANGQDFYPIGTVNATANSNEATDYNFTDNTVSAAGAAVVYYRLKMVDNNGKYVWSNITTVKTNGSVKATTVTVYPNPTADFVNVNMNAETEAGQISIVDAFGKTVQTEMTQMNNNVQFDVRNLQNGIYFVQISNNDGSTTSSKFIKR
jgi:hypothetical protein